MSDDWTFSFSRKQRRQHTKQFIGDLLCSQIGTTNTQDPRWSEADTVGKLLKTYTTPVYHVASEAEYDMCYDRNGERAPYVESYTIHVWTTDNAGNPIVNTYTLPDFRTTPCLGGTYSLNEFYRYKNFPEICEGVRLYRGSPHHN